MSTPLVINGTSIPPGRRTTVELPAGRLYTHAPINIPVHVVRGRKDGPRLFVSAAIHGDEINGVEIIRRLLGNSLLRRLRGTLIAVPVVNVHGFVNRTRYLPDRRDLNRSFPGSEKGSLAARLAHLFMTEVVANSTHGIDLHTGAIHRSNLPQIRANVDDPETRDLALTFGTPMVLNSDLRDGSLRQAAADADVPILLYEAGEALRFDEPSIRAGVSGIIEVMRKLGMLPASTRRRKKSTQPVVARTSGWVRAPQSGILRSTAALGARVHRGSTLGIVADPFGAREERIEAPWSGVIIGRLNMPLAYEGDALYHIARFEGTDEAEQVEASSNALGDWSGDDDEPSLV
ncbi:succinylglutamate desuccinylase/aspartoacylase family protein [Thiohalospira sp.]|uniref:succinylglutamate desuccinylase/aspartoacylase family protein n=1 Tax=Thiohalospira sp. TaxID=3080549 RepID=UPI003980415E